MTARNLEQTMQLVEVKITGQAITAKYGTLNSGDILRTDAAFARHLVKDCSAAEYVGAAPSDASAEPESEPEIASNARPRKGRAK